MAIQNPYKLRRGLETNRTGITPLEGELIYTTDDKKVYVGDGSTAGGILVSGSTTAATMNVSTATATASQTAFTVTSYTAGNEMVFLNGVLLVPTADYARTNSTTITLTTGADTGDQFMMLAFTEIPAVCTGYLPLTGGSLTGSLSTTGDLTVSGAIETGGNIYRTIDTSSNSFSGGTASNVGANMVAYGSTHATLGGDLLLRSGANAFFNWDESAGSLTLSTGTGSKTQCLQLESNGTLNVAGVTNYETLVTADDDIPNKKYVDDLTTLGQHTVWIPALAMKDQSTSGATQTTGEITANSPELITWDFDPSTDEFAQFVIQMPKSWNEGTLIAQFVWTHNATDTNFDVVWGIQAQAYANDDSLNSSTWGTAVTVTDTGGTTADTYISAETAAITVGGTPGAEELVYFRVYRDADNASDTLAVDGRLLGVKIHYTIDAVTDD